MLYSVPELPVSPAEELLPKKLMYHLPFVVIFIFLTDPSSLSFFLAARFPASFRFRFAVFCELVQASIFLLNFHRGFAEKVCFVFLCLLFAKIHVIR